MSKKKKEIDFIGIGAEKSGTTWIANCLREHSEVFVPKKKEIFFFNEFDPHYLSVINPKYEWGIEWYESHFADAKEKIKGEFSPTYIYDKKAAKRIRKHYPDIKLLVVLRDPVARAFSQFIQDKRFGLVGRDNFPEAIRKYSNYLEKGLYYKHLTNYLKLFPKKNILVLTLDEIKKNPKKSIHKVYNFLELKKLKINSNLTFKKTNFAAKARFPLINMFMVNSEYYLRRKGFNWILRPIENWGLRKLAIAIRELNSSSVSDYPVIDKKTEKYLRKKFVKDIKNLEKLLNKNLFSWKYGDGNK